MTQLRRVAIIGGNRIPFARSNGPYATASNQAMLTAALEGLIERYNLHGLRLGEVAAGAVLKHSRDFNLTRECVLGSRLSPTTPAYDIQQACGTGLEAALLVANKIALGQIDCGIAGGVDTTSDAPIGVNEGLRKILLQANRAKSTGDKLKTLLQLRPITSSRNCRAMASRAPACPWASTASRWSRPGTLPAPIRINWPWKAIRKWPPPTPKAGRTT
ncbi:hypothetical protein PBOI14_08950 [Pseudomonas sp. Boi14]|nr:hypothetical protein PBOI14_08950 [Pseudomonas sp. Boi14]